MSKKTLKIVAILSIVLCIVFSAATCFADDLKPEEIGKNVSVNTGLIGTTGGKIAAIIRNIGIAASVIILMILGIKYMMGSAEEKAEYKKTMIPYVVGAVILFGASAIAGAIVQMAQSITA